MLFRALIFLFCASYSYDIAGQDIFYTNHTIKSGLPSNTVYFAFQDSEGFMWFGTDSGVCRYDGHTFTTFTPQDKLSDNEVFQIAEDSQHRIWFLTFNGRLSYYKNGIIYNAASDPILKELAVEDNFNSFLEDSKKRIWFSSTFKGINILNSDGTTTHLDNKFVSYLWEEGDKILGIDRMGIVYFDKNNPSKQEKKTIEGVELFSNGSRRTSINKEEKVIYSPYFGFGLCKIEYSNLKSTKLFQHLQIFGLLPAEDNQLWVYHSNGAFLWNGYDTASVENVFNGAIISHAAQDKEGGYWFTTLNKGILYAPSTQIKKVFPKFKTDAAVRRLIHTEKGEVMAMHEHGEYVTISPNDFSVKNYMLPIQVGDSRIDELVNDRGATWVAGKAIGLIKLHDGRSDVYFPRETIKHFSIDSQYLLHSSSSFIRRIDKNLLEQRRKKSVFDSASGEILFNGRSFTFHQSSESKILIGTNLGLALIENKIVKPLSSIHPYLSNRIVQIKEDKEGNFWIVVDATGVVVLNPQLELIGVLDESAGIINGPCFRIFINEENKIWAISQHTVYQTSIENNKLQFESVFFLGDEIINDLSTDNKSLWIASSSGLIVVPITYRDKEEIHTIIKGVYINGNKIETDLYKPIRLSYNQNNIRINYTALNFKTQDNLFRYKLADKNASSWTITKLDEIEFSSLAPGDFTFQLQAKNADGSWSSSTASFHFSITNPIWNEWWVIVLGMTFLFAIATAIVYRAYQGNLKKILLKDRLVESELRALVAQMNPHFIFNTLNTIQSFFITNDVKTANRMLSQFSSLMRKILDHTSQSFISVEDEVEFLKNYLDVEKMRFNNQFEYEIDVQYDINAALTMIPSMTIQPFIENAIIHGLTPKKGNGKVIVQFNKTNDQRTHVRVEDNGVGRKQNTERTHTPRGISLINERLSILNAKNKTSYKIEIIDLVEPERGTRVDLCF
jgi:ligand-binding sensor domain-containing protein/two-component sensor histidine kinase